MVHKTSYPVHPTSPPFERTYHRQALDNLFVVVLSAEYITLVPLSRIGVRTCVRTRFSSRHLQNGFDLATTWRMNGDSFNLPRWNKQYFTIHQEQCGVSLKAKECSPDSSRSCVVKYDVYTYTWGQRYKMLGTPSQPQPISFHLLQYDAWIHIVC